MNKLFDSPGTLKKKKKKKLQIYLFFDLQKFLSLSSSTSHTVYRLPLLKKLELLKM